MNINITLLGEMITFAVLVWVVMKYIWPPIMKIIEERQEKIASGLEAAEQGRRELEQARNEVDRYLQEAKIQAAAILEQANKKANDLLEICKANAQIERNKVLSLAKLDLEQEVNRVKEELQQQTVDLVIVATEKILHQKMDDSVRKELINKLISNI